ncbi:MAG: DUF932 domain-containing protein [Flavobacteriales bacterium]|nr:DUF932 domain-containing protein [Flavobacteriales bacterium]
MLELDQVAAQFTELTKHVCRPDQFKEILLKLLPEPNRPRNADQNPGILKMWETKRANVLKAREHITKLRDTGKGMDLVGSRNTFWRVLNAITEFVDHHKEIDGSRLSYALLGEGMDLKLKAYRIVQDVARQAA